MSLETRRRIIELLVIMDEQELLDMLAHGRAVVERRNEKQSADNVRKRL